MVLSKEKLQEDLQELCGRRETAYQSYHQVLGAISIIEQMIFRLDLEEKSKQENCEVEPVPSGDVS